MHRQHAWIVVAWCVIAFAPAALRAEEPFNEFLLKLREAKYFDTALEFLDRIEKDPAAPQTLKVAIEYERGATLIEAARVGRDPAIREKQLDEALAKLTSFLRTNPSHILNSSAKKHIGDLMVERARILVERARGKKDPAGLEAARAAYAEAGKSFEATEKAIAERLKQLPPTIDDKDPKLKSLQEQLRVDRLQTQLLLAAIKEEAAETYEKTDPKYKEMMLAAAKGYGDVYDLYRTRLAGLYAHMYQGRCHQKVGDDQEALSYFRDLLEEPDTADEVRALKTKVLVLAIKSWSAASQKKYVEAVTKGNAWLEKVRPSESKEPDWLELRLGLARAMHGYSIDLKAKDARQSAFLMSEARKLATFVSKLPGDYQKEARKLLEDLGVEGASEKVASQPKTFSEAYDAGQEAIDTLRAAQQSLAALPAKIKAEKDPQVLKDLQQQFLDAQSSLGAAQETAQRSFEAALRLAKLDTDTQQLNLAQYSLCYLAWLRNDLPAAALLGEYVAQRYPESPGARQSAKIAMAARVNLFAELQKELRSQGTPDGQILEQAKHESENVIRICDYITRKWPDQVEAQEALNTLIPFMISTGQLTKAEEYLKQIPADSPTRGGAELKTGQAMWSEYLKGTNQLHGWEKDGVPLDQDLAARRKELADLKGRAQKTLEDGVARMKKDGATSATFAAAMLSLAQIYIDTNQPARAIKELEDPVGPLALVRKEDPSAAREGFAEETLKVALRSYIGALAAAEKDQAAALLAKAQGIMDDLKKSVGTDASAQEKLVKIYIGIAGDLKRQIEDAGSAAAKSNLSQGFETFLQQVGKEGTEFNTLNWVAETYYKMGEAFETGNSGPAPPEAKKYYQMADSQFKAILVKGAKVKGYYDPKLQVLLQMRAANCKRKLGDCAGAIKDFEEILQANPTMVNIQVEAARTFQECGVHNGDAKSFYRAIMGGENRTTNKTEPIIWGWGIIQRKTSGAPQFRDTFYEARYNLAVCRFQMAKLEGNAAKRKELMEGAERDIRNVAVVDRDYGGETWRPKFDTLARHVQKELKKKQEGLKAFDLEVKPVATK